MEFVSISLSALFYFSVIVMTGCSPSSDEVIYHYVSSTPSADYVYVDCLEEENVIEGWEYRASAAGYKISLPIEAESRDFGFVLRNYNGMNVTVNHGILAETALDVFFYDLNKTNPVDEVLESAGLKNEIGDTSVKQNIQRELESLNELASRNLLSNLFDVLAEPKAIESSDCFEAFLLLAANDYTAELGDTLWRFQGNSAEGYAGISISNSESEHYRVFTWVFDDLGEARLFIPVTIPVNQYRASEFQALMQCIVSSIRFEPTE